MLDLADAGDVIGIKVLAVSARPGANLTRMASEVLTQGSKPAEAA